MAGMRPLLESSGEEDREALPQCLVRRLRHVATILDARVAQRILQHLELPARAPLQPAARVPPPFWPSAVLGWAYASALTS
jgi:hypothetical protein